jgi:hypothetical protein
MPPTTHGATPDGASRTELVENAADPREARRRTHAIGAGLDEGLVALGSRRDCEERQRPLSSANPADELDAVAIVEIVVDEGNVERRAQRGTRPPPPW